MDTGSHPGVEVQPGAHRRQRKALIVATGVYHDPKLEDLSGPSEDAKALIGVLRNHGRFDDVDVLRDQTQSELRQQIFEFFRGADPDDLLLLYISCHGIRDADADGTLYFATSDTRLDALPATALECAYVNKRIDQCRSNRVVLFVDCCSAGAIHGPGSRGPELLTFQPEDLPGRGRVVITAATALQQAADVAEGSGSGPSVFASALVQGIETGEADHDRDGKITVIEAFHYVEHHLRERGARQTPRLHAEGAEGELALAWLRRPDPPKPLTSVRKPRWYTHATFYELLVRGFYDSNGDGVGDLRGVLAKADYLEWLGVQAVVLLRVLDSPWRDGGFDVRNFTGVTPELGTIEDLSTLVEDLHRRGIRVLLDVPLNHTSDEHPWFQASRSDPHGPYGDYYVWNESPDRFEAARVLRSDVEESNWAFDPKREAYYWHRYLTCEPDLNFDNPSVADELIDALRFWLELDIDGFRLDAVPYLYERDLTNCENLPETHAYVRRLRAFLDSEYPDAILVLGANQQPKDVVAYFGDPSGKGEGCHIAYHFPVMPQLFIALHRGERFPICETLSHVPDIPGGCQWGIVLRNLDELSLEVLVDEEREVMLAGFASDPRMAFGTGIRRRLAPLVDNDRRQLELLIGLLLSLPGSPFLYYGDEIGMGDNIYLGERDAVRTPMQWSPDRNAGFSAGDTMRLYLPVIADSAYGYAALNVEHQMRMPASLLHWTRSLMSLRKRSPALAAGSFTDLGGTNPAVLAFARETDEDLVICVSNLSRFPQSTTIDLGLWEKRVPRELRGGISFSVITRTPYTLTLAPYGFFWLELPPSGAEAR